MPDSPNAQPVPVSLVRRVAQGVRYAVSGVTPNDWFGPSQPLTPLAQDQAEGRVLDYRVGYNLLMRPREEEAISFHQLRALADACNFLRLVIETRKDQMERLTWTVQPRLRSAAPRPVAGDARIPAIEAFLRRPDGHNSWATWLRQLLEELLVTDAVAIYRRRNAGGQLYGLQQIDGTTIKRLIDESGLTPAAPDPAYQQILHGLPAVDYTADQLLYLPRNPRIHRLYGFSPVEQVVMTVNIALRRTMAQLNYFTEGNIPEALISCPPDWRPSQIREMQEIFDDMLRGDLAQRSGAKFVPGGLSVQFTKDALLKDDFDEWLARIICYAFSVSPTAFVKQTNRATADSAQDTSLQEGLAPLQNWVKALMDRVLAEDFAAPDLEFAWNEDRSLSASEAMSVNTGYVAAGLKTRNEVRADIGLDPLPGGDTALVTTAMGLVPITGGEVAKRDISKDWHFDPSQPRDDQGRWTAGAGSASAPSDGAAANPVTADDLVDHPDSGDAYTQITPVDLNIADNRTDSVGDTQIESTQATGASGEITVTNEYADSGAAKKPVDFQKFFDTYQPFVRPMAQQLDTDSDFFLAIIAKEDAWGTDPHNMRLNNFFGVTYAGGANVGYDSPDEARQYWIDHFGDAVRGASDINTFIDGLKSVHYNTKDKNYYKGLDDVYDSVLSHRLQLGLPPEWIPENLP